MKRLLSICALFLILPMISACSDTAPAKETLQENAEDALLSESEDMGEEYIDSIIFLGESTTYHMKSRGVLKDGSETKQIWAPEGGTMTLDMSVGSVKIVYPETGEKLTVSEAAARKKPKMMILTFGLNGAVQNIKKGEGYFKSCYSKLISAIRAASPSTVIILQSAFPVAKNMDMSRYSVSYEELNRYIDKINLWSLELSAESGLRYLSTADILKGESGALRPEYQQGDGYHLTEEAYRKILGYIRTHGYKGAVTQ
ncbi:MAG: hypothetical protein E7641_00735 [Ruminococcaceae bacterium]|nr:hypothetical protein [Oscillospiraceae bacterium]